MSRKRIAMLVKNSVSHDARVIKEAESLSSAGYEVAIIGIMDNRDNRSQNVLEKSTTIYRVPFRAKREHSRFKVYRFIFISALMIFMALMTILANFSTNLINLFRDVRFSMPSIDIGTIIFYSVFTIVLIMCLVVFYKAYVILKKQKKIVLNYQRLDGYQKVPSRIALKFSDLPRFYHLYENMRAIDSSMFDKLVELEPEIVHCHDLNTLNIGYRYKKSFNCKLVYDSHEIFEEQPLHNPLSRKLYIRMQEKYSSSVDYFITINESIAEYLGKTYPSLPEATLIMNASPLLKIKKNNALREKLKEVDKMLKKEKEKQTIKENESVAYEDKSGEIKIDFKKIKILLYQGGFAQHRGLDTLVKSSALYNDEWILVMMGWGNFEAHLLKIAKQLGILNRKVFFIPPVSREDLFSFSSGANLGIIPYENTSINHYYCTPNKLWEFPASGLPIIISPFPELLKYTNKYNLGWAVDSPLTTETIKNLLDNISDVDYEQKVKGCKEFGQAENWGKYEKTLIDLYRKISVA
jgi:hypothetical protein